MTHTAQSIINIFSKTQSLSTDPIFRKLNIGWLLSSPFEWNIINRAAVLARMDEDIRNSEKGDQVKVALASLRHFAKLAESHEVGMGAIRNCLKIDAEINIDAIKKLTRDQVAMELRNKPMSVEQIVKRRTELQTLKLEQATAQKAQNEALLDEVYFLCNSSDSELSTGVVGDDAQLVDFDEYGYIVESLLEKLVRPLREMRIHLKSLRDRSFIASHIEACNRYLPEIEKLMVEAGIDVAKLDGEEKRIEDTLLAADAEFDKTDAEVEAALAAADAEVPEPVEAPVTKATATRVRVPQAVAQRQAEETAVKKEAKAHGTKMAQAIAKAKATKSAKKQAALAE